MVFPGYLRKLMGWCPMKDSFREERKEANFPGFKLETRSIQPVRSTTDSHESRILRARVTFLDFWTIIIIIFALITSLIISFILWAYIPEDSFLIASSGLIIFLMPPILLLNRPGTVAVMSGKIIVRRPIRKPVVIEKKDIMQISVTRSKDYSLRWLTRLFSVIFILFFFVGGIMSTLRNLERSFTDYVVLSLFMAHLSGVLMSLVLLYNAELLMPYQQTLKVITRSNLELRFFTDEPEELTGFLKDEKE
ncbi:TPA: DUF1673 family protein [Methanosarcinaceae archaeon]|nr:DUF1673 family protein [Methanosarcinaceae archaeon]